MKHHLFAAALSLLLAYQANSQDITLFGATATNGGTWAYDAATSRLTTGGVASGDSMFGVPINSDLSTALFLSLTADAVAGAAPLASFSVVLEDDAFLTSTATFDWSTFAGGATVVSPLVADPGFDFGNVGGWLLSSSGNGSALDITFTSLSATSTPEPSTWASLTLGAVGFGWLRRNYRGRAPWSL